MKRLWPILSLALLTLLITPAAALAIPESGCWCPGGAGTQRVMTTWGAAPAWSCQELAQIGRSSALQSAESSCSSTGVCSIVFSGAVCTDEGCATQHTDEYYTFKCYLCIT
jgi:hypothetical protein